MENNHYSFSSISESQCETYLKEILKGNVIQKILGSTSYDFVVPLFIVLDNVQVSCKVCDSQEKVSAFYQPNTNSITICSNIINDFDQIPKLVTHELIHAIDVKFRKL